MQLYYPQMANMGDIFSNSAKNIIHVGTGLRRPPVIKLAKLAKGFSVLLIKPPA